MKTKILTITDKYKTKSIAINVPVNIWFNAGYELRGKLKFADRMTISQFITTSDTTLREVFEMMDSKTMVKFCALLESLDSSRADKVDTIISSLPIY